MQTRAQVAVASRFAKLLRKITPDVLEQEIFAAHQRSIQARLKAVFATNQVVRIGSYVRRSAIKSSSDIDLLLVLKRDAVKQGDHYKRSDTVLQNVRYQLQDRFTKTDIGRDGQVIVVSFRDGLHPVDVVPGFFSGPGEDNYPVFCIPDGYGWWTATSPQLHNKYISDADKRSGGKLKSVARLVKYWSTLRSATQALSGFHVELLLAQDGICIGARSHADCVAAALELLVRRRCRALQNPKGVPGLVAAAGTDPKREALNNAIQTAAQHCKLAMQAERCGATQESIRQWNMVFSDTFPR
jgi:predicted nucleotidyltransferase